MVSDQLAALAYEDENGAAYAFRSAEPLDPARRAIYAAADPDMFQAAARQVFSVSCVPSSSITCDGSSAGGVREFLVALGESGDAEILWKTCEITCAEVPHSELVEYQFEEPCSEWRLCVATKDAVMIYIAFKFKAWRDRLYSPTCEAEFRRMLQNGLVSRLYDHMLFPTPSALAAKYEVLDDKSGKTLKLPHPVVGLRIWNPELRHYDPIDPRLAGAPPLETENQCWEEILTEFRTKQGAEYINKLLNA